MADKPTTGTTLETDAKTVDATATIQQRLTQFANSAAIASAKPNNQAEVDRITKETLAFSYQIYARGEGQKLLAEMAKTAPGLLKSLAEGLNTGGITAMTNMLEAQQEANKAKQKMYQDQVDRMYQARLATADGPAKLMATFKGFAMLLQSFGVDCSNFIAECDKNIDAEYAKVPEKNIEGLSGINAYSSDPRKASEMALAMQQDAQRVLDSMPEVTRKASLSAAKETRALAGAGPLAPPTGGTKPVAATTPTAPAIKPVETRYVTDAVAILAAEKHLITADKSAALKADLNKGLVAAANADGDAKTVSGKDLIAVANTADNAIKAQGGKPLSNADAMNLAREAIERARGLELAGPAPSPR